MAWRIAALLLLLFGLVSGKAGPNTALRAALHPAPFALAIESATRACPPNFALRLTRDLPNPGWKMKVDRVTHERDAKRIVVDVTLVPSTGMHAQVIVKGSAEAQLGSLRKGRWVIVVRSRRGAAEEYRVEQATVLDAS